MVGEAEPPWSTLTSGYRVPYDPRPLLDCFRAGESDASCWEEVWDKLHHQGDVGTASYAVLPVLVDLYASRIRGYQIFSYAALLEECREEEHNPELPDWLEDRYEAALDQLRELALLDLRGRQPTGRLTSIFAFLAHRCGCPGLSVAVHNLGDNDIAMEVLEQYGESLNDL